MASASQLLSDRGAALALLAIPFGLALIAFFLSVGTTAMGEMVKGSARFYIAAFSYTFLMSSLIVLPAYMLAYGWYWWRTKPTDTNLVKALWMMPLIAAALVWFPAGFIPQGLAIDKFKVYLLLAGCTVVLGYAWIGVVRSILRFWRNI